MELSKESMQRIEQAVQSQEKLQHMSAGLVDFYARQNATILRTLARHKAGKPWAVDLAADGDEEEAQNESRVAIPVNAAFFVNLVLLVLKLIAAGVSGSLAVVSSSVDSALDLVSGSIIFATAVIRKRRVPLLFPVGRARLEPLSIIIFSSVMSTVALLLIREASSALSTGFATTPPRVLIDAWTWSSLGAAIGLKLLLLALSRILQVTSPSIKALEVDHVNDIVTNTFTLIFIAVIDAQPQLWWLDPAVAIALSLYILYNWALEGLEHVNNLSGRAATPDQLSDLIRIALAHDRRVLSICTVRAYTVGERLQVEIDIVLPATMELKEAHDIGQSLQISIEKMDAVERCYVHLDTDLEDPHEEHVHPEDERHETSVELALTAAAAAAHAVMHLESPICTPSEENQEEEGGQEEEEAVEPVGIAVTTDATDGAASGDLVHPEAAAATATTADTEAAAAEAPADTSVGSMGDAASAHADAATAESTTASA